ncbi:glutamate 5-kinase, partial [Striga asiatica]
MRDLRRLELVGLVLLSPEILSLRLGALAVGWPERSEVGSRLDVGNRSSAAARSRFTYLASPVVFRPKGISKGRLLLNREDMRRGWRAESVAAARKNRGELLPSLLQNRGDREIGEGEKPRILGK